MANESLAKEVARVSGVTWSASSHGTVYTGPLPSGLGAMIYQYEGNKLIATVDVLEMTRYTSPHVDQLLADDVAGTNKSSFLQLAEANVWIDPTLTMFVEVNRKMVLIMFIR